MITNIMKDIEFEGYIILFGKNRYENALLLENADLSQSVPPIDLGGSPVRRG